jgi:hypothetical protein
LLLLNRLFVNRSQSNTTAELFAHAGDRSPRGGTHPISSGSGSRCSPGHSSPGPGPGLGLARFGSGFGSGSGTGSGFGSGSGIGSGPAQTFDGHPVPQRAGSSNYPVRAPLAGSNEISRFWSDSPVLRIYCVYVLFCLHKYDSKSPLWIHTNITIKPMILV